MNRIFRFLLLLFSISIVFTSYGQNQQHSLINQDTSISMEGKTMLTTITRNGIIIEVIRTVNGKREGIQEVYNNEGIISVKATYHNGYLNGEYLYYWAGNLYEQKNYRYSKSKGHSLLQGKYKRYKNNLLAISANYKDSLKNGIYKEFFGSKLYYVSNYKKGFLVGKKKKYSHIGKLLSVEHYKIIERDQQKQSVLNGKAVYYSNTGILIYKGVYKNGMKEGLWKDYNRRTGILLRELHYKHGRVNGEFTEYYRNGELQSRGIEITVDSLNFRQYFDGLLEEYDTNGVLTKITNYDMGKKTGRYETYYSQGKIDESGDYINNLKTGKWLYFDSNGDTLSYTSYKVIQKNGKDISIKNGIEKQWGKKKLLSKLYDSNGVEHGVSVNYFSTGQVSKQANYNEGLLEGEYTEYYENGQIKTQKKYKIIKIIPIEYKYREVFIGLDYPFGAGGYKAVVVGWDYRFKEDGHLLAKRYMDSLGRAASSINYVGNIIAKINYYHILNISYSPDGQLMSIAFPNLMYPMFSQRFYRNGYTRAIGFQNINKLTTNTTILYNDGKILFSNCSAQGNPDSLLPNIETVNKYVNEVGRKFIPNNFYTDSVRNGKYILRYASGKLMCIMEFKEDIPNGNFVLFDAVNGDTIMFRTYKMGVQIGYYLEKFAGKNLRKRGEFYASGKSKWTEEYGKDGRARNRFTYDESGKRIVSTEYWKNGKIKSYTNTLSGVSVYYNKEGIIINQSIIKDNNEK